jgi:hypothetical protein
MTHCSLTFKILRDRVLFFNKCEGGRVSFRTVIYLIIILIINDNGLLHCIFDNDHTLLQELVPFVFYVKTNKQTKKEKEKEQVSASQVPTLPNYRL